MKSPPDHVFLDLERQGNGMLQIAVVRTAGWGIPIGTFARSGRFMGYSHELGDILQGDYVLVSSNPERHAEILREEFTKVALPSPLSSYKRVGWNAFVWPYVLCTGLTSSSVRSVADSLGVKGDARGTLTGDVSLMAETYWSVMRSFKVTFTAGKVVKDLGRSLIKELGQKMTKAITLSR